MFSTIISLKKQMEMRAEARTKMQKNTRQNLGFTIIELIVVIAIFTIIMGVILFNQAGLNSNILVTNLAYEIGMAIREAQVYGIGVRAENMPQNDYQKSYGANFNMATPNQVVLFFDSNDDGLLDAGEEKSVYTIQNQRGNKITAICTGVTGSGQACSPASSNSVSELNVLFRRPNPEAMFTVPGPDVVSVAAPVVIVVNTPDGKNCRVAIVETTGQIRVDGSAGGYCVNQ